MPSSFFPRSTLAIPSIGAATTPSVSRATEVLMAFSTDSILEAPAPSLPSAKSTPIARADSSRLMPSFSISLILAAMPGMPISFSTLSARSTASGTSTSLVGSRPRLRAVLAICMASFRPFCMKSKYSEVFMDHSDVQRLRPVIKSKVLFSFLPFNS